jgi:hypothetical protein
MASERDFEMLDDYIGNRLSGAEKAAFEGRLNADPELQRELKLQQGIVDSLRKARAAELKAMLNNIPPSAIPAETSSVARWAGVALVVIVAVGLYFYLQPEKETQISAPVTGTVSPNTEGEIVEEEQKPENDESPVVSQENTDQSAATKPESFPKKQQQTTNTPSTEPKTPKMDVFDPTGETTDEAKAPENISLDQAEENDDSDIRAQIVSDHKNYNFHYQFTNDKLILYGAFDKNLYEIMEFISEDKRTIFLYFNDRFYLLNTVGEKVKPLSPVSDPALIQKLKQHRAQ